MKLLVIEDSSDVRLLIQLELVGRGYTVVTADCAETGLELAARERPSAIISDLGLPGLDGITLIHRVRADDRLRGIPAIALSGFGEAAEIERALSAGYHAALVKPFETAELVAAVERVTSALSLETGG
jgi:CheY-like chemotaxis protein